MADQEQISSGGFSKTTNFKWLAVGLALFILIGFVMPLPASMSEKAASVFSGLSDADVAIKATNIQIIIALLAA